MTAIGILGSGNVAWALAAPLHRAGHEVLVGSRVPDAAAARWAGSPARVTTLDEAAGASAVVVDALPGDAALDTLTGLAARLDGKVLADVANAVTFDADGFAAGPLYPGGSLAEEIQRALPSVRVVKTLSTMHVSVMAAPGLLSTPPTAFLSGEAPEAKAVVRELLTALGWEKEWVLDLGGVESARAPEAFVLMVGGLVRALGPVPFALSVAR